MGVIDTDAVPFVWPFDCPFWVVIVRRLLSDGSTLARTKTAVSVSAVRGVCVLASNALVLIFSRCGDCSRSLLVFACGTKDTQTDELSKRLFNRCGHWWSSRMKDTSL